MHLRIVKLESGVQVLPVIKKILSGNCFSLDKSSFLIKSTKNIRFRPNLRMLNSYTFALYRIKITSLDSTINKRKNISAYPTARKHSIFIKKIAKIQLFGLKCTIHNRYAFESRNIEMINLEVTKN